MLDIASATGLCWAGACVVLPPFYDDARRAASHNRTASPRVAQSAQPTDATACAARRSHRWLLTALVKLVQAFQLTRLLRAQQFLLDLRPGQAGRAARLRTGGGHAAHCRRADRGDGGALPSCARASPAAQRGQHPDAGACDRRAARVLSRRPRAGLARAAADERQPDLARPPRAARRAGAPHHRGPLPLQGVSLRRRRRDATRRDANSRS